MDRRRSGNLRLALKKTEVRHEKQQSHSAISGWLFLFGPRFQKSLLPRASCRRESMRGRREAMPRLVQEAGDSRQIVRIDEVDLVVVEFLPDGSIVGCPPKAETATVCVSFLHGHANLL